MNVLAEQDYLGGVVDSAIAGRELKLKMPCNVVHGACSDVRPVWSLIRWTVLSATGSLRGLWVIMSYDQSCYRRRRWWGGHMLSAEDSNSITPPSVADAMTRIHSRDLSSTQPLQYHLGSDAGARRRV